MPFLIALLLLGGGAYFLSQQKKEASQPSLPPARRRDRGPRIPTGGDEVDIPSDWTKLPKGVQEQIMVIMGSGANDAPAQLRLLANFIEKTFTAPATVNWLRAKADQLELEGAYKSPGQPTGSQPVPPAIPTDIVWPPPPSNPNELDDWIGS